MAIVSVRPRARKDLDEIGDFIAQHSATQADAFIERLSARTRLLAKQPDLGRLRDDLSPRLKKFSF